MKHITTLLQKNHLTTADAEEVFEEITQGVYTHAQIAAILTALQVKGEHEDEVAGFIRAMRKHMKAILAPPGTIDTCGTGGDGAGTFNISTTVALVVAAAGVPVAKHGNRNASSKCGSADVLEALGVHINLTPEQAQETLRTVGLVFLFAPAFHPALKHIAQIRRDLGFKTIFNYLGPFCNPAQVKRQLIGVPDYTIATMLARVAARLGYEHLMIVSGRSGLDEIGLSSETDVLEVKGTVISEYTVSPAQFKLDKSAVENLAGGDATENAEITKNILSGGTGPKKDIVVLNAGHALYVAGKVQSAAEGVTIAERIISSGKALQLLEQLINHTNSYGKHT